ncbi:MAG: oligosaccharide flippase family protein [Deltaproteobacteria bacterium]|nr:oligosaccharide flippase family protein [Deltaproteobacteria bacterium]
MTEQHSAFDKDEMKNLLSKNFSISLSAKLLYLFSRLFLPPLTLAYVSLEEYGIWACCFILISYVGMSSFGISNVYIRYVAEYKARNRTDQINCLLSTGLTVTLILDWLLLILLWFALPSVVRLFKIPPSLSRTAFILIFGTAVTFTLDLSFGAFSYVLTGLQRITEQTLVWVASFLLEAGLIVVLLVQGFGIYALLWAFVARYILATIAYVILCFRLIPGLSLNLRHFDRASLRLFSSYGVIVQVTGLLSVFLRSVEKLLAGLFVGIDATGLFEVGEKFPIMALLLPGSMNDAFLPAVSHLHTLERPEEIRKLYLKGSRYMNMMTGVLMAFLAAFAAPLLTAWIGPDPKYQVAAVILTVFTLPYQLDVLTGPGSAIHRGMNKPFREMTYHLSQLFLLIITASVIFLWIGKTIMTIIATVALSMILSALYYLAFTNRVLAIPQGLYSWQVLVPGILPYFFAFASLWLTRPAYAWGGLNRWRLIGLLTLSGAGYCLLSAFFLYRVVCDWGEREYLRLQLWATLSGVFRSRAVAKNS